MVLRGLACLGACVVLACSSGRPPVTSADCLNDLGCDAPTPWCDDGVCVACTETSESCGCHGVCVEGACVTLAPGAGLEVGDHGRWVRDPVSGVRVSEGICNDASDCPGLGTACNPFTGACLAIADHGTVCSAHADCGTDTLCDAGSGRCLPAATCVDDAQCCGADALGCHVPSGRCAALAAACEPEAEAWTCPSVPSAACGGGMRCTPLGACADCLCDGDCGAAEVCSQPSGTCIVAGTCRGSGDCRAGETCRGEVCVPQCDAQGLCPNGFVCGDGDVCVSVCALPCDPANNTPPTTPVPLPAAGGPERVLEGLQLCSGDTHDVFVEAPGPMRVQAVVEGACALSGEMTARAADDETLIAWGAMPEAAPGRLLFDVPAAGTYRMQLRADALHGGPYTLNLRGLAQVACADPAEGDGRDDLPAVAPLMAARVAAGVCERSDVGGRTQIRCSGTKLSLCGGDVDYYPFVLPADRTVSVALSGFQGDLQATLLGPDPERQVLSGPEPTLEMPLAGPETYWIRVARRAGMLATPYTLTMTWTAGSGGGGI